MIVRLFVGGVVHTVIDTHTVSEDLSGAGAFSVTTLTGSSESRPETMAV